MREYAMTLGNRIRLILQGVLFHFFGLIWFRLGWADETMGLTMPFTMFLIVYGAMVLAKPFFSKLVTADRELTIKDGLWPARRFAYRDIGCISYDSVRRRLVLHMEEGGRYVFEYIYEDVQTFLSRMGEHGIDILPKMKEKSGDGPA